MIKRKIVICMFLLLILLATACGKNIKSTNNNINDQTDTFIDCIGREVEIPKEISRVAAIDAFTGEAMVMIGAGENMVACPNGVKSDILLQQIYPKLNEVSVVQSGGAINAEALLALNPDVVLVKYDLYALESEIAKLDKLNIPYLVIEYSNMAEQIEALHLIGEVVDGDALKKAELICDYYQGTIDRVKKISQNIQNSEKLTVFHSINQTFRTDGPDSLGKDWIKAVGCINVSVGEDLTAEGGGYFTSQEQVYKWDPDIIICNANLTKNYFETDEAWQGLRAIYENNVYNIPVGATRWGQEGSVETFFGMLWLGVTVYPEYYNNIDLKSEVVSFYKDVLGIELNDKMYEMMLSGDGIRDMGQNSGK